ncbi:MAG: hypothetical protein JWN37_896 [Candidatus Nomurabacteria bacterium]|nr:hypothetical protein [Candidatus Nomurabacteria bacterium]
MMIFRAQMSALGIPTDISHGEIEIKIKGSRDKDETHALVSLNHQIRPPMVLGGTYCDVFLYCVSEHEDEFDSGNIFGMVTAGEGEALAYNPIGTTFGE